MMTSVRRRPGYADEFPGLEPGARAECSACGRALWLRKVAEGSALNGRAGHPVFGWCGRRGTSPPPLKCPSAPAGTIYHSPVIRSEVTA